MEDYTNFANLGADLPREQLKICKYCQFMDLECSGEKPCGTCQKEHLKCNYDDEEEFRTTPSLEKKPESENMSTPKKSDHENKSTEKKPENQIKHGPASAETTEKKKTRKRTPSRFSTSSSPPTRRFARSSERRRGHGHEDLTSVLNDAIYQVDAESFFLRKKNWRAVAGSGLVNFYYVSPSTNMVGRTPEGARFVDYGTCKADLVQIILNDPLLPTAFDEHRRDLNRDGPSFLSVVKTLKRKESTLRPKNLVNGFEQDESKQEETETLKFGDDDEGNISSSGQEEEVVNSEEKDRTNFFASTRSGLVDQQTNDPESSANESDSGFEDLKNTQPKQEVEDELYKSDQKYDDEMYTNDDDEEVDNENDFENQQEGSTHKVHRNDSDKFDTRTRRKRKQQNEGMKMRRRRRVVDYSAFERGSDDDDEDEDEMILRMEDDECMKDLLEEETFINALDGLMDLSADEESGSGGGDKMSFHVPTVATFMLKVKGWQVKPGTGLVNFHYVKPGCKMSKRGPIGKHLLDYVNAENEFVDVITSNPELCESFKKYVHEMEALRRLRKQKKKKKKNK